MCVIIAKNKGVAVPDRAVLERCWNSNIDGAGFSVTKDDRVLIKKGFMKFADFYDAIKQYNKDDTIVIHFRRTTQGGSTGCLTHPFPLDFDKTKNEVGKRVRELELDTYCAIAHNGVIPMTSTPEYKKSFPTNSDTEIFVRDIVTKLFEKPDDLKDEVKLQILSALIGTDSKLAIHTTDGIKVVGWFNEKQGAYFSNFSNAVHFDSFQELK